MAVTRAPEQAGELLALLRARGAEALACAAIAIERPPSYAPLDAAIRALHTYDWLVFTSANAVAAVADRLLVLDAAVPNALRIAAVGAATARAVATHVRAPDFAPAMALAESLAAQIPDVAGRRVLWTRGDLAGDALARRLRARGAAVDEVIAYRTVAGEGVRELARLLHAGRVDAILFMSASSVRHVLDAFQLSDLRDRPAVICIGPATARAARDAGIDVDAVADEKSDAGIIDAVERWFARGAGNARDAHADAERG